LLENEADIKVSRIACKALFIIFILVLALFTIKQPICLLFQQFGQINEGVT
jgi:hypothetical protein